VTLELELAVMKTTKSGSMLMPWVMLPWFVAQVEVNEAVEEGEVDMAAENDFESVLAVEWMDWVEEEVDMAVAEWVDFDSDSVARVEASGPETVIAIVLLVELVLVAVSKDCIE
jgi:hypothetical protein